MAIRAKASWQIDRMRQAGRMLAEALELIEENIRPGVTTAELDRIADEHVSSSGAYPVFKGYKVFGRPAYPAATCMSVNEEVVHGIPSDRALKEGDILSVDIGAKWKMYIADTARTFAVGVIDEEKRRLLDTTQAALEAGIAAAQAGRRVSDVSRAIQTVAEGAGFSVVRQYCGHGLGRKLHEEPQIPNYVDTRSFGDPVLPTGATVALEPMVNAGGWRTKELANRWTVVTRDGKTSAHFEHTIVVRESKAEVLTKL